MLTNAAVKAARPRAAAYKLADAGGLLLYVTPQNLRRWRWRFRWQGREQLMTIGDAFELTLDQARARRDQARALLDRGEDPRQSRSDVDAKVRAFEYISRRWHAHMLPRWTTVHATDVLASLERDVFPVIGAMPIGAITTPVVLAALRSVEERGRLQTARRVRQRISAVFAFAIAEGITDHDLAAIVARALTPPAPPRHQPALLDVASARELLAAADRVDASASIKLASRFLALTAVRLAAVRGARWSEIEDLDGDAPLWRVPAGRMKLKVAKKADARNDHVVPLAPAAVELLRTLRTSSEGSALISPGRDPDRPIGEAAIGALYDRAGFAGRHVPHGWRATFSTIMNGRGDFEGELIEVALAHAGKDKVRLAYDRNEHQEKLRLLFDAWAIAITA